MITIRKPQEQNLVFPAQRFEQGGRKAYSMVMSLGYLDSNIPAVVSVDRIQNANRRFIPAHSRRIAGLFVRC